MTRPIETYRGFVYPWTIDHVGHMNVQFYTARFDEASWQFLRHLGLTPSFLRAEGRALVALEQTSRYRKEVLAGSLVHVRTELVEAKNKTLRFVHRMIDSESGDELATTDILMAYLSLASRRTTPLPESVADLARQLVQ